MNKVTASMIDKVKAKGGMVKKAEPKKQAVKRSPTKKLTETALEKSMAGLVKSLQDQVATMIQQLESAKQQNIQLQALVSALKTDKPVRLKVHRDMDRQSQSYLLMEYMDVVPVEYERKLNS